jgi:NAD(P)-dependent dehydrogenase (short-subunit alcohol dehydrogenase family)
VGRTCLGTWSRFRLASRASEVAAPLPRFREEPLSAAVAARRKIATPMRLVGKAAIVTGTGDGIGRGIALRFAREGAKLAICDVQGKPLEETVELLRREGAEVEAQCFDLRDAEAVAAFVDRAAARFGRLDVLVHNAAIMPVGPVEDLPVATIDAILAVNLRAAILLSKYVTPHMRRAGGGSIVHMSSVTGHNGFPGVVVYGATKGALHALARGQAMELAPYGIRVNTVSPGTVDSPMLHAFIRENASDPEAARRAFDEIHPRGKIASIDEVASVFVFLASDEAANVTAEDIRCDGGFCVRGVQPRC